MTQKKLMPDIAHQNVRAHEPAPVMEMVSCAHHHGGRQTISIADATKNYCSDDFFCKGCKVCDPDSTTSK